jgi:hypothetical protein
VRVGLGQIARFARRWHYASVESHHGRLSAQTNDGPSFVLVFHSLRFASRGRYQVSRYGAARRRRHHASREVEPGCCVSGFRLAVRSLLSGLIASTATKISTDTFVQFIRLTAAGLIAPVGQCVNSYWTAAAAFSIRAATSLGCDRNMAWLPGSSIVSDFALRLMKRSRSGLIMRSCCATTA